MKLPAIDPARVRALTERLVAYSSVSPDPGGETACAQLIRAALPAGLESGAWPTDDGRPVVWAHLRGRSRRTVVLLTHYDTVGVEEYAALDPGRGARIGFDPDALRTRLLEQDPQRLPEAVAADLEQERRAPGTWMFGRGALDMKSGVAAGVAALETLATSAPQGAPEGHALLLACPDEENQSAGMRRAVEELVAWRAREDLELMGAINLDYGEGPWAYQGVAGKLLLGVWVLGAPTHVGDPFAGVDAVQLAAALVTRLTTSPQLVERGDGVQGVPPVALQLRDRKPRYDVQTALEAEVELNLLTYRRSLAATFEAVRAEVVAAMHERERAMASLAVAVGRPVPASAGAPQVLTYPELVARAGIAAAADPLETPARDGRRASFDRVRSLARAARLTGPAVVMVLLPPFYPHAEPGGSSFGTRIRSWLAARAMETRPWYPFITDASYVAWRPGATTGVEALLPALGREYRLPIAAARALDLDVINLGPWGRDAHGLYERVHAPHAFGILPGLIAEAVARSWEAPSMTPEEDL